MIGFISVEVATTPYAGGMIQGAQDALSSLGYMLLTVNGDTEQALESEIRALNATVWMASCIPRCRTA